MNIKNKLALWAAKLALILSPKSTSAPGLLALKIAPNLLQNLLSQIAEAPIFITGTNGKSTTAGFLANILNNSIIHNKSGANLASGLATILAKQADWNGSLKAQKALLEIDEAVLRRITKFNSAQLILVTNFFRDQLDRFGEMQETISLVQEGLKFEDNGFLVTNADDPNTCHLKADNILYYGISSQAWNQTPIPEIFAEELASCPNCDFDLNYKSQWLGQLGDFCCKNCNYQKPKAQIQVIKLQITADYSQVSIQFPDNIILDLKIPLPGLFNVYNALGAVASAYALKISLAQIKQGIETYKSLFGRSQSVNYKGKNLKLFLIKNPIGASEILRLIQSDAKAKVLIAINDNYADGRDVSWLWDAQFEYLANNNFKVYVSGTRGSDMAVRLKYAGVKRINYYANLNKAINEFAQNSTNEENLYIMPTYTALLQITQLMKLEKN